MMCVDAKLMNFSRSESAPALNDISLAREAIVSGDGRPRKTIAPPDRQPSRPFSPHAEAPRNTALKHKAVLCLGLLAMVLGGYAWNASTPVVRSAHRSPPVAANLVLPGAAITIPAVPAPAPGGGAPMTIVLRAATNCPPLAEAAAVAARLAQSGVKRVLLQFKQDETDEFEGGSTFFPSTLAPLAAGFEDRRLLHFAEQLAAREIEVCAWVPLFHDPTAAHAHPEWRALTVGENGSVTPQANWLCPRHPEALAHEAALVREAVQAGHGILSGVYVDFIRFDDDFSCVCERCLSATAKKAKRAQVRPGQVRAASERDFSLWKAWGAQRGDAIHDAADAVRDEIESVAPDLWLGACVLPFSAQDYRLNTQSGQDFAKLCRAGIDELMLMGYWDDWELSPKWLADSLRAAEETTRGEANLTCLLDGDMTVQRTMATLEALRGWKGQRAFFHYGSWSPEVFAALRHAESRLAKTKTRPKPEFTAVVIRIDTEPDAAGSYDAVNPGMIRTLTDMFAEEKIQATFVTCGRLAELQAGAIKTASQLGHEIAVHAYNHEQLDSLPVEEQLSVVDGSLEVFRRLGIPVSGFGAPRNSITREARDRLIAHGLLYDGSAAYDPMTSWMNADVASASDDPRAGIVVLPFIIPNDYDARMQEKLSAPEMQAAWVERLRATVAAGDPLFVVDVHQWTASQPDNLAAVRGFIRFAKSLPQCRVVTLRDAAQHVLREGARIDGLAWRWRGDGQPDAPAQ
jgi:peptidoglycan/xylan/chitin deacetylase (PgdA/CDA1 family)